MNLLVAQVSKPAVSPTSKSAALKMLHQQRVWKPATQQTWKSAPRAAPVQVFKAQIRSGKSLPAQAEKEMAAVSRCTSGRLLLPAAKLF
jgi:hypothetical protein